MNLKPGLMVLLLSATVQLHAELSGSFEEIKAKAEAGDIDCQNHLASMYAAGIGVETNYTEAAKWSRKAADKGNAAAQHNLGALYENGQGVPQDFVEAATWYRKAAEQGN